MRIPATDDAVVRVGRRSVRLTHLDKVFWPEAGHTKRALLQYYADVADALVPHLRDRAMVMKRYPNGIHGKCFFMKRTPPGHPAWLETCSITHKSASVIACPMVQDRGALLGVVNLVCIDLKPSYARRDVTDRHYELDFALDPGPR